MHLDDLFDPAAIADPYPFFAAMRAHDPIYWNARHQLWVVTSHADVVWMVRHNELFSSAVIRNDKRPPYPPVDPEDLGLFDDIKAFRAEQLVEQDQPLHSSMRHVVRGYFTPGAMEKWRPFVRDAVADLFDGFESRGHMNVLEDLAAPLPVRVIAEMMGVPPEDRDHLRELADKLLYLNRAEPDRLRPLTQGVQGMMKYVAPLVDERIGCPGRDFISVLTGGEREGVFTRHQVMVNTALLLFAGHETTMNLICNGTRALLSNPEQWEMLRADPAAASRLAVEECLRFEPPVKSTQRIAAVDVEHNGHHIKQGDRMRWIIAAANRDPSVFPEPDRFNIARHPNPHVAFGSGVHYCLGATLARIEGQEVFRAMAERLPNVRLDTERFDYQPSIQFRSLKGLPVRWS